MKKLLAAAVFALLGTGAFAQTSQGTVVVTGNLGFNSSSIEYDNNGNDDIKNNRFNIGPTVGYFVKDNLVVGLGMSYSREVTKSKEIYYGNYPSGPYPNPVDVESNRNGFFINTYIEKYYSVSEKVFLTGSGSVSFGKVKNTTEYNSDIQNSESNNNIFRAGISPGISFFPTSKFGLSASFGFLGYSQSKYEYKNQQYADRKSSEFGLDLNNSLSFGFSYYISR